MRHCAGRGDSACAEPRARPPFLWERRFCFRAEVKRPRTEPPRASGVRREAAGRLRGRSPSRGLGPAGMDEDGLPIVGSGIDLTKVRAALARRPGAVPLPPLAAAALALVLGESLLAPLPGPARPGGRASPSAPAAASPDPLRAPALLPRARTAAFGPAAEIPQRGFGGGRRRFALS